jgi:ribosome-associated translation inhibitor RaiA
MTIRINNNAGISNQYIRWVKWQLYKLKRKYNHLMHVDVYVHSESAHSGEFSAKIILGLSGDNLIMAKKSSNLKRLFADLMSNAQRYLRKKKEIDQRKRMFEASHGINI